MPPVPTVKIQNPDNPDDYIIINEKDYEDDQKSGGTMTLWQETPEVPQDPPPPDPPPASKPDDPEALHAAIVDAIRQVIASGSGLTAAGIPKVEALEEVLGYDVSADERNKAWAEFETE